LTRYLLDSNVVIDWLNGRAPAPALLDELNSCGDILTVNAITITETYSGIAQRDVESIGRVLASFEYWQIDFRVARLAGEFRYRYARLGRPLAVPDVLLAAHAVTEDSTLITANVKDFPMPELKLLSLPPR